jgi:hypothetical protein
MLVVRPRPRDPVPGERTGPRRPRRGFPNPRPAVHQPRRGGAGLICRLIVLLPAGNAAKTSPAAGRYGEQPAPADWRGIRTAVGASDDLGRAAGRPDVGETTVTPTQPSSPAPSALARSLRRETMSVKLRRLTRCAWPFELPSGSCQRPGSSTRPGTGAGGPGSGPRDGEDRVRAGVHPWPE